MTQKAGLLASSLKRHQVASKLIQHLTFSQVVCNLLISLENGSHEASLLSASKLASCHRAFRGFENTYKWERNPYISHGQCIFAYPYIWGSAILW